MGRVGEGETSNIHGVLFGSSVTVGLKPKIRLHIFLLASFFLVFSHSQPRELIQLNLAIPKKIVSIFISSIVKIVNLSEIKEKTMPKLYHCVVARKGGDT